MKQFIKSLISKDGILSSKRFIGLYILLTITISAILMGWFGKEYPSTVLTVILALIGGAFGIFGIHAIREKKDERRDNNTENK
jgi:hypothetical protein